MGASCPYTKRAWARRMKSGTRSRAAQEVEGDRAREYRSKRRPSPSSISSSAPPSLASSSSSSSSSQSSPRDPLPRGLVESSISMPRLSGADSALSLFALLLMPSSSAPSSPSSSSSRSFVAMASSLARSAACCLRNRSRMMDAYGDGSSAAAASSSSLSSSAAAALVFVVLVIVLLVLVIPGRAIQRGVKDPRPQSRVVAVVAEADPPLDCPPLDLDGRAVVAVAAAVVAAPSSSRSPPIQAVEAPQRVVPPTRFQCGRDTIRAIPRVVRSSIPRREERTERPSEIAVRGTIEQFRQIGAGIVVFRRRQGRRLSVLVGRRGGGRDVGAQGLESFDRDEHFFGTRRGRRGVGGAGGPRRRSRSRRSARFLVVESSPQRLGGYPFG
mmetsp:Transcript_47704/g.144247  ORF Transcript_47704/g.144247 Transcript_47704/m.144247 type:complete len:385 (+) Transcript_47704:1923-3077(+)